MAFRKIAVGVLTATSLALSPTVAAADLKIGMITTLSGGGASLGIDVRDGFLLALKQAGDSGVELIVEDDERKPDLAVQIADRMIQRDKVDIMTGIIWSNLAMAVIPPVVAQDKIYISPNAGPSALAGKRCHPNYFNIAWQNDSLHEVMGAYAQKKGYTNTFILAPFYPGGQDALAGYKRFYYGGLADEVYTRLGQTDYSSEIEQIRASDADSIFFFLPGGMGVSFIQQLSQSGINIPVLGPAFSFDQNILTVVGEAAVGMKNSSQWANDIDNPANVAFVESYRKEYGRLPSIYSSQGFDAANLILSATKKADISDMDAFRKALKEADFASVRGNFRFGNNNHPIQDILVREVVMDGGVLTNKTVTVGIENHQDAYAAKCKM